MCAVVVPQCLIKSVVESEEATDVEALGSLSKKFLPTLLSLLDACPPEDPASAPKIVSSTSDMAGSSNTKPIGALAPLHPHSPRGLAGLRTSS